MADSGISVEARVSNWLTPNSVVVFSLDARHFTVVSTERLPDDQVVLAVAKWMQAEADKREVQELREDCEAGMCLNNARQALKDLEWLAILDRLKGCAVSGSDR